MSARSWNPNALSCSADMAYLDFLILTNGTSNPTFTYNTDGSGYRGEGVASVVRAAAGRLTVTLADGYRYVTAKSCDLEDYASGSDDGAYATLGPVSNEGLGNGKALTFDVFTRAAAGTKTDYGTGGTGTPRRLSITLSLKLGGAGK